MTTTKMKGVKTVFVGAHRRSHEARKVRPGAKRR